MVQFTKKQLIYYLTPDGYVRSARIDELVLNEDGKLLGYIAKTKHGVTVQSNETAFYDNKIHAYKHIQANANRWIDTHTTELRKWRVMRDRADDALKRLGG